MGSCGNDERLRGRMFGFVTIAREYGPDVFDAAIRMAKMFPGQDVEKLAEEMTKMWEQEKCCAETPLQLAQKEIDKFSAEFGIAYPENSCAYFRMLQTCLDRVRACGQVEGIVAACVSYEMDALEMLDEVNRRFRGAAGYAAIEWERFVGDKTTAEKLKIEYFDRMVADMMQNEDFRRDFELISSVPEPENYRARPDGGDHSALERLICEKYRKGYIDGEMKCKRLADSKLELCFYLSAFATGVLIGSLRALFGMARVMLEEGCPEQAMAKMFDVDTAVVHDVLRIISGS